MIAQRLLIILLALLFSCLSSAKPAPHSQDRFHHPEAFIQSVKHDPKAPEKVFTSICASCHSQKPTIPLGAPRIGIKADWEGRVKQGPQKLFERVNLGLPNMPARGGVF